MQKPAPSFTIDDLLAEMMSNTTADGMTTRELCEARGLPPTVSNLSKIGKKVQDGVALGQIRCVGKKLQRTVAGYERLVPAYELVQEEDKQQEVANASSTE